MTIKDRRQSARRACKAIQQKRAIVFRRCKNGLSILKYKVNPKMANSSIRETSAMFCPTASISVGGVHSEVIFLHLPLPGVEHCHWFPHPRIGWHAETSCIFEISTLNCGAVHVPSLPARKTDVLRGAYVRSGHYHGYTEVLELPVKPAALLAVFSDNHLSIRPFGMIRQGALQAVIH